MRSLFTGCVLMTLTFTPVRSVNYERDYGVFAWLVFFWVMLFCGIMKGLRGKN